METGLKDITHGLPEPTMETIKASLAELRGKVETLAEKLRLIQGEKESLMQERDSLHELGRQMELNLTEKEQTIIELQERSTLKTTVDVGERLLYLSPDEREALERQISDLLSRINVHLG